jgi:hypothetical protein
MECIVDAESHVGFPCAFPPLPISRCRFPAALPAEVLCCPPPLLAVPPPPLSAAFPAAFPAELQSAGYNLCLQHMWALPVRQSTVCTCVMESASSKMSSL